MSADTVPQPAITMRRATLSDAPQLAEFYRRHFADRPRLNDTTLWEWEFALQPYISNELPFFVLDSGHRIEGGIGFVRLNLHIGAQTVAALHPVNFFVNPGFKGLHALRLFRAALSEAPVVLGSYVSEAAAPLVKRSGFVDLSAYYNAYYLPLRFSKPGTSAVRILRAAILNVSRRIWISILDAATLLRKPNVSYHVAETLNTNWLEHASTWRMANCAVVKDVNYISWRYASSPALNCRYIWQMRGDKPIALAIMHLDRVRGEAVLLDCMADSTDLWTLVGLLAKTMCWARRSGAGCWLTSALSTPLERALRTLGCGWHQSPLGLSVLCMEVGIRDIVNDYRNWHFMVGDTDVY
jgi:hypothetical protein